MKSVVPYFSTLSSIDEFQSEGCSVDANANAITQLHISINKINCCYLITIMSKRKDVIEDEHVKNGDSDLSLESRVVSLEALVTRLTSENIDLRQAVTDLRTELTQYKERIEQVQTPVAAVEHNISLEQQSLNNNIVIRGVDVTENSTAADLHAMKVGLE
ncbi:hypothetical protein Bhyg_00926 [Pseudolycoriella hygida]|uniref:Uncharacterized protein n=1 Tax=Pseudolycoriella hygida TaxID=35572 RepID=A0A9Q0N995_9DIPT|nr:hypothetical protein Bhyg_00926 [Pseudolycoriella hygida]